MILHWCQDEEIEQDKTKYQPDAHLAPTRGLSSRIIPSGTDSNHFSLVFMFVVVPTHVRKKSTRKKKAGTATTRTATRGHQIGPRRQRFEISCEIYWS
ncbi:hypothetical protein E2C01_003362 [Portunus trituberculatus]|uniref:Uncharacterized protein n=1 Tax=Portunus trituberculatus TaxID=210409 RepID=A0A5B7CM07_PORTR|nr:hypothetical protein [Portunus trituberculatus]